MIKIIKPGTKKTAECENCGCLFSYEPDDVCKERRCINDSPLKSYKTYICCPQCDQKIVLSQTR